MTSPSGDRARWRWHNDPGFRELKAAANRRYRQSPKGRTKERERQRATYDPAKRKAKYQADIDRIRARGREYWRNNADERRAYYEANKERIGQRQKAYRATYRELHREEMNLKGRAYRKRYLNLLGETVNIHSFPPEVQPLVHLLRAARLAIRENR